MFHKTGNQADQLLSLDRTAIALNAILFVLWSAVVLKTYNGS